MNVVEHYIARFKGIRPPKPSDAEFLKKNAREISMDKGVNTLLMKIIEGRGVHAEWLPLYFEHIEKRAIYTASSEDFLIKYVNAICGAKNIEGLKQFHNWFGDLTIDMSRQKLSFLARCVSYGFVEGVEYFHKLQPETATMNYTVSGRTVNVVDMAFMRDGVSNSEVALYLLKNVMLEKLDNIEGFWKKPYCLNSVILEAVEPLMTRAFKTHYKAMLVNAYDLPHSIIPIVKNLDMSGAEVHAIVQHNRHLEVPLTIMWEQEVLTNAIQSSTPGKSFKL